MDSISEITIFTVGDANAISTWSNVPYFFTKSIADKNIHVNKVNIKENALLNFIYRYTVYAFLKIFYKNTTHTYFRSRLNYFLTNIKIRRSIKRYNSSQAFIFLTFSFGIPKTKSKKIVLFGDWSYLYLIRNFHKREPFWFEKRALNCEEKNIRSADFVLSLFPESKKFNTETYKAHHCYYLGNVINSSFSIDKKELVKLKSQSKKLLFIGNKKYLQGALDLIQAFKEFNLSNNSEIELHIIGLNTSDTGITLRNLFQHGYLDKGNKDENTLYYKLISEARFIVNTNKNWGAFSAMTEAMYYYTPVITTPYSEFVATYGKVASFGFYVESESQKELGEAIEKLLKNTQEEYHTMMNAAHDKVKDFTWERYTDKLLELIS
ncbi:glycosyltransferase [Aurantibacillus circumpalustris]|uniref:glycosyltransferase n=1 Tax=Aurantibacillus circumpalustris TaxID=3036359 RepID=UPI00295AA8EA|nr:glycosyltransferase [Aurantibacillus circumpalustris]